MTTPLRLRTSDMSPISEESANTSSPRTPARGRETRALLLQKLRPPQLVHGWDCWIERSPTRSPPKTPEIIPATTAATATVTTKHTPHLTHLSAVNDVRAFWSLFNNLPLSTLPPRTTCYLFHQNIKPVWEDERNARGGAWTFRIPHAKGPDFFEEICLLAIGEVLQGAVEDETRFFFRDDICGVSFSPRAAGYTLVSVWNRDGDNETGIKSILETIMEKLSPKVKPQEGSWYYKKHADHPDFVAPTTTAKANGFAAAKEDIKAPESGSPAVTEPVGEGMSGPAVTMAHIEDDVRKVRKILEELKVTGGGGQATGVANAVGRG